MIRMRRASSSLKSLMFTFSDLTLDERIDLISVLANIVTLYVS